MSGQITQHDRRTRRCPMLGHDVPFAYCRAPGSELPCRKVFDCWWETFDVTGFIRTHYSPDQIARMLAPRPDKLATIAELIERARRDAGQPPPAASAGWVDSVHFRGAHLRADLT